MRYCFFRFVFLYILFLSLGCRADMENVESTPEVGGSKEYFESFSGYEIPLNLIGEITKVEAESKKSFYVGYYDDDRRLIRVEKYYEGAIFFVHDYEYYDDSFIKKSIVKNKDGVVTVSSFEEGKLPIKKKR